MALEVGASLSVDDLNEDAECLRNSSLLSEEFSVTVYSRYYNSILQHIYRITGSWEEAEELAQEVFIRAFTRYQELKDKDFNIEAWLYRVANNATIDWVRKRKTVPLDRVPITEDLRLSEISRYDNPEAALELREIQDSVKGGVDSLSSIHKAIVVRWMEGGLTQKEIGAELGISGESVKTRFKNAKLRLRVALKNYI